MWGSVRFFSCNFLIAILNAINTFIQQGCNKMIISDI